MVLEEAIAEYEETLEDKDEQPVDKYVDGISFFIGMEGIRDGNPTSLITKEHFAEMMKFEDWL